jgi:hypothetical protein
MIDFLDHTFIDNPYPARGQTIVDRRPALELEIEPLRLENAAKVDVTLDLDVEGIRQLWLKTIDPNF